MPSSDPLDRAAELIAGADAVLVCAGAGMGVDSGLPDYRGYDGFWRAYPPYARLGLTFAELADPGISPKTRSWPGVSTATGSSSTGKPNRTKDFRPCWRGGPRSPSPP